MTKLFQMLLVFILTIHLGSVLACEADKKDCTMDKETWIKTISSLVPADFCKASSPFIKCYDVSQTRCYEISVAVTQQCMTEYEKIMPNSFNKDDSKKWGEIIGTCAGDKLTNVVKLKAGKDVSCGL